MTPKSAWEAISQYIPKDKVIWEPFMGDGTSGMHLTELGFNVIHDGDDFFECDKGDIVVSNPPFTKIPQVLERLKKMGKPFIIIMPSSKINTQYYSRLFSDCEPEIQIMIPRKRIQFLKMVNGVVDMQQKRSCNFDCFYYSWKMDLPRTINYLK
jgi:hypothetical protein